MKASILFKWKQTFKEMFKVSCKSVIFSEIVQNLTKSHDNHWNPAKFSQILMKNSFSIHILLYIWILMIISL
jgi:hypothetical protein